MAHQRGYRDRTYRAETLSPINPSPSPQSRYPYNSRWDSGGRVVNHGTLPPVPNNSRRAVPDGPGPLDLAGRSRLDPIKVTNQFHSRTTPVIESGPVRANHSLTAYRQTPPLSYNNSKTTGVRLTNSSRSYSYTDVSRPYETTSNSNGVSPVKKSTSLDKENLPTQRSKDSGYADSLSASSLKYDTTDSHSQDYRLKGSQLNGGNNDNAVISSSIGHKSTKTNDISSVMRRQSHGIITPNLSITRERSNSVISYTEYTPTRRASISDKGDGLVGLINIGNTCFMNSILQCLSNTRLLRDYCLSNRHINDINKTSSTLKGDLIRAFASLIQEIWGTHNITVQPTQFKRKVDRFSHRFADGSQQDAHEFLLVLLEGLHEDVNKILKKPIYESSIESHLSDTEAAQEAWTRYQSRDSSFISDLFVGLLKSTLQCSTCKNCSVTFDPFWDLSVPIKKDTSMLSGELHLKDCLKEFTKSEVLEGDEKPMCDRCKTRHRATKRFSIERLPKILVIHLKRFSVTKFRTKLSTHVEFPISQKLNLNDYVTDSARGRGNLTYTLYGVVNHSGTTYGGHYIANCRSATSRLWHKFNDSRVSETQDRTVRSSDAYVLFYELANY